MHETLAIVLLVAGLAIGLIPIVLTVRFKNDLLRLLVDRPPRPTDLVAVIIPCKGIDQGFRENIQAFLSQDYTKLALFFVVATEDDPAYAEISDLLATHDQAGRTNVQARLLVAGINNRRAQKLTNQLHGISNVGDEAQYLVFLDSDLRPDPGFVGRLISPLNTPHVGATTGFRWYHPSSSNLGSMLRSTWNAGALTLLTNPQTVFAFGGAMAMRRDTFEVAKIAAAWDAALSDDFPLTLGVKQLGLDIRFVPSCVAVSYEYSNLADTIEFTNRQSIISRVYFPPLWWGAAIAHSLSILLIAVGALGVVLWLAHGGLANLVMAGCLAIIPFQFLNAALMLKTLPGMLPQIAGEIDRLRWRYMATAPLATVLSLINTAHSLTTRRIIWRGIEYELVSPTETRVLTRGER